jgi:signal transduction histidine kinase
VNVLSDIIFVSRRIWQPSEAVPLGERQDCDYSLEIDHRAKQLAADLLADRAGAALDRACELSAAIATQADGGEGISVDEIALLAQSLEGARAGVVQTLDELRSGSPAQPGLMAAMSALAEDCQKHWGVSCVCHFGAVGIDVDATQMRHLCALARDAVEYAVHRRHATNIRIAVKMSNQELRLDISDDAVEGPSFADSGAIMALINRRAAEMGGSVTLEPSSSGGQILSCAISLSSS